MAVVNLKYKFWKIYYYELKDSSKKKKKLSMMIMDELLFNISIFTATVHGIKVDILVLGIPSNFSIKKNRSVTPSTAAMVLRHPTQTDNVVRLCRTKSFGPSKNRQSINAVFFSNLEKIEINEDTEDCIPHNVNKIYRVKISGILIGFVRNLGYQRV